MKFIKNLYKEINTGEKWLLLFMGIIFFQLIYNLIANEVMGQDTNIIDAVVRTAAASIFGYFLGSKPNKKIEENNNIKNFEYDESKASIVAIIGLVSLLTMIGVRNFMSHSQNSIATLSQLRDFVSASVGYLVSSNKINN